jgi:hypothetical protein
MSATATPSLTGTDDSVDAAPIPVALAGVPLGAMLGAGGMGRVFRAHHPILDVPVAVKVLFGRGDPARFLSEARLAAKVQHQRVVRILHAGEEQGYRFLVLEFLPGGSLKELVARRGPLPWREAFTLAMQAAEGLAAGHRLGIVHRDVKPSNLLLDGSGGVKVADLGVARSVFASSDVTAEGQMVGTPAYMAPEQVRDARRATPASDLFALGATLVFLLTGAPPSGDQAPRSGLPRPAADLLARLLSSDPAARPRDGAEAVQQFERVLGLATASTIALAGRPSRGSLRWLAAAMVVGAIGMLGWAATPASAAAASDPPPPAAAPPAMPLTPPRSVFVLATGLDAAARAGLDAACLASGLPRIERAAVDALVREQELAAAGRIDPATAPRVGRLLGGHIAVLAEAVEDRVAVRAVLVETGELAGARLCSPAETAATAGELLLAASRLLPVEAAVANGSVQAGARHGVRPGDAFTVAGAGRAVAEQVTATTASLRPIEGGPIPDGALARRLAP